MNHETVSMKERFRKGYIPWDETKAAKKNARAIHWTQFYHKPYQCDWREARRKAIERIIKYEGEAWTDGQ